MKERKKMQFGTESHAWLPELVKLAQQAGAAILHHYQDAQGAQLQDKADGSPLTAADLASHDTIIAGLQRLAPDIAIISEENRDHPPVAAGMPFWLVDPLDGTKEFLNRNGEFTVNIALLRDGEPVLAVVHAPVPGTTYVGQRGVGAWRIKDGGAPQPIVVSAPQGKLRVVASRSHSDEKTTALLHSSSSAWSPKAARISIRAWARRWNGIPQPRSACWKRPGAWWCSVTARRCGTIRATGATRISSPSGRGCRPMTKSLRHIGID
jgi:3'(2'),5'-bisphosphate nucleotidase